jgi:hypothetical protein
MTNVRSGVAALLASIAWAAAACGSVTPPSPGPEPDVLDDESPFTEQAPVPVPDCADDDHATTIAVWQKLRRKDYPYHLQAIALSPPFASGCRALIVAEPPPTVSLAALRELAPGLLARAETQQHEVGYDGWTRDVVVTLPPMEEADLAELIAGLHLAMFESTYRIQTLDTSDPVPRYDPKSASLDVGIGPGDLHGWLLDETTAFVPLDGGDPVSFKQLLADSAPAVYLDDAHGLVAWIVPRRADIAEMAGQFRQFALDADLIVGAVASSTTVAIIARRRAIDPRILPPLRFETVSLLAALHARDGLQQSFDRTHPLAGRIDAKRDWAPIYLNPELVDTEYGSLLNIADQFLKSWSNNGRTKYLNFDYPPPRRWAFPAPVYLVANARSFRYNWNTTNVGAVVHVDDVDVFWLRRTGALNVSYFPDEDELAQDQPAKQSNVLRLEETAYQFFVKTQTPMLARVVQYNALFQIFVRFGVGSSTSPLTNSRTTATRALVDAAREALWTIRVGDEAEIDRRLANFVRAQTKYERNRFHQMYGWTAHLTLKQLWNPPDISRFIPSEAEVRRHIIDDVKELTTQLRELDPTGLAELGNILGDPRSATTIRSDVFWIYKQVKALGSMFPLFASPDIHLTYAHKVAVAADAWIHTPSIVISWNQPNIGDYMGGHDLRAKIATVTFRADTPMLATKQIAKRLPIDAVGAKELPLLELGPRGLNLARAPAPRTANSALGNKGRAFWTTTPRAPEPAKARSVTGGSHEVVVTKLDDGYRMMDASGKLHEVTTMPEVVDWISRGTTGNHVTIRFASMAPDEVRRVLRAAEIRTRATMAGVVKPPPEFAIKPLDFAGARLRATQTRTYADGAGQIGHVIEIPGPRQLSVSVKVAVRHAPPGVLQRFAARIRQLIESLLARLSGKRMSPSDFSIELRKELQQLMRNELPKQPGLGNELHREPHRLEIKIQQEATDFTIVQREPPTSHGTRDLTG